MVFEDRNIIKNNLLDFEIVETKLDVQDVYNNIIEQLKQEANKLAQDLKNQNTLRLPLKIKLAKKLFLRLKLK